VDGNNSATGRITHNLLSTEDDMTSIVDLYKMIYQVFKELQTSNPSDNLNLVWPPENIFTSGTRQQIFAVSSLFMTMK
jgi:hypothetical protein